MRLKVIPILVALGFLWLQVSEVDAQSTRRVPRRGHSRLICKTDALSKAAIYDYYRGYAVDDYFSKTLRQCWSEL